MTARLEREEKDAKAKYIITLWKDEYDYEGLWSDFYVLFEGSSKEEALAKLVTLADEQAAQALKDKENEGLFGFRPLAVYDEAVPGCGIASGSRVNAGNKVVCSTSRKVGDGTGYNSIYFFLNVVEVAQAVPVSPELFENCSEVWSFFGREKEYYERQKGRHTNRPAGKRKATEDDND